MMQDWEQQARDMAAAGCSTAEAARALGIPRTTLRRWAKLHDVRFYDGRDGSHLRTVDVDEARRLRAQGLSFAEIGRRLGATGPGVRYALMRDGIEPEGVEPGPRTDHIARPGASRRPIQETGMNDQELRSVCLQLALQGTTACAEPVGVILARAKAFEDWIRSGQIPAAPSAEAERLRRPPEGVISGQQALARSAPPPPRPEK